MGKYKVTTLMHKVQTLVRNLLCLLNAILWLLVLYFSTHEDKIAAVLSYLSVMLTVILIKYGFGEIKLNEAFACLVDTLSKTLILTGIPLALLSQSWNTAFYSICLGFVMEKMKYETESPSVNEGPSQSVKLFHENIKNEMFEAYKDWETYFQYQNEVKANMIKIDNLRDLKDRKLSNKDEKITNCIRNTAQIVKRETLNEIDSSDKTGTPIESYKIPNSCKVKHLISIQNSEGCNRKDIMLHAENTKNIIEKGVIACALKQTENVHEPKTESSDLDSEDKFIEIASLCVLKAEILNMQELELNECYKALSDCKSDETVNVKELKRNNRMSNVSEVNVLNDAEIKLYKHDVKQMDSKRNMAESQSEEENMLKTGFSDIKVNVFSNVSLDIEESSSNFEKHDSLDHQNEVNLEYTHPIKDSRNSFKSGISNLDINLPHKQDFVTVDAYDKIEEPEILLNKRDLQRDTLVETNGNSDPRKKYETTTCPADSINVQPKLTCEYRMDCMSELNYDENVKTIFEEGDSVPFLKSEDSQSETLQSSCIISYLKSSPKDNEATVNADNRNDTEFVKEAYEEASAIHHSEVSNVEDVVNRIDLGFIYSIGFNVPA